MYSLILISGGKLVLFERIKNTFYFDYFTTLACPHVVHCLATHEKIGDFLSYDLSMLKNYNNDVKLTDDESETIFSVCKPVVDQDLFGCPVGSAICKKILLKSGGKKKQEIIGLGVAVKPPKVIHPLGVIIDYEGGSVCKEADDYNDEKGKRNRFIEVIYSSIFPLIEIQ